MWISGGRMLQAEESAMQRPPLSELAWCGNSKEASTLEQSGKGDAQKMK